MWKYIYSDHRHCSRVVVGSKIGIGSKVTSIREVPGSYQTYRPVTCNSTNIRIFTIKMFTHNNDTSDLIVFPWFDPNICKYCKYYNG